MCMSQSASATGRPTPDFYEFGIYRLEPSTRSLYRAGEFVPLTPKVFDTLLILVEEAGRVVSKDELMQKIWPDAFVEEGSIANNISTLRKILNPDFEGEGPIATIARRGYRFTGEVRLRNASGDIAIHSPAAPPLAEQSHAATHEIQPLAATAPVTRTRRKEIFLFTTAAVVAIALSALLFGIHSFASRPSIAEKDSIIITDFDNKTGDPLFDNALRQALAFDLDQSPRLNIIPDRKVASTLRMMGRSSQDKLMGDTARDLCQRVGGKAMLAGSISALDNKYFFIDLQAINCATGESIVTRQARASSRSDVLNALDQAASSLREKLGESLASVQKFSVPVPEFTTPSLEALKSYSIGHEVGNDGNDLAALPYIQRAVQIDPNFASAYSGLAIAYGNLGESARAAEAARKAYELRDRVSEHERLRIAGNYFLNGLAQLDEAGRTYEMWMRDYPHDIEPHINQGQAFAMLGRWDDALAPTKIAVDMEPDNSVAAADFAIIQLAAGRYDDARKTGASSLLHNAHDGYLRLIIYQVAFVGHDVAEMQRQLAWAESNSGDAYLIIDSQGDTEAYYGRLNSANSYFARAVAGEQKSDNAEIGAAWLARAAMIDAEFGETAEAKRRAAAALALSSNRDVRGYVAMVSARTGDIAQSKKMADALSKEFPQHTLLQKYWLPCIEAAADLHSNNPAAAIQALAPVETMDLAWSFPLDYGTMYSSYLRGEAYLQLHNATEAAAQFQKIIDHPGVIVSFSLAPLAHLGLARAYALGGDKPKSRTEYDQFLSLWKSADPDLPILHQAQSERAQLN